MRAAAAQLVEAWSLTLAVLNTQGDLAGFVTEWDTTRATAQRSTNAQLLEAIMTLAVIFPPKLESQTRSNQKTTPQTFGPIWPSNKR